MKQLKKRLIYAALVLIVFVSAVAFYYIKLALYGKNWATYPTNKHIYNNGLIVKAGDITDKNGTLLAYTKDGKRRYNDSKEIRMSTLHAVGDLKGYIATGVHSAYLKELCGYNILNGVYNKSGNGNNIELTIDSDLCVTAKKALGSHSGAVGVYNYKTGEIVCMTSTPTYDPESTATPGGTGVYMNRLLSVSYTPGSIFKLVTTLSALENINNAGDLHFTCKNGVTLANEWLSCMGRHNNIGLDDALVYSCNAFFAQTALRLGRETLTKTAQDVGFNKTVYMDRVPCAQSKYNVDKSNDIDFGWSGIGQYTDLVNPFQYMRFMGAIANGGVAVNPYLVKKVTTHSGITLKRGSRQNKSMLSKKNAERMTQMMRNNVIKNYGDYRFKGLDVCGKTGTAEVGKKENTTPHSWFTGFCNNPDKPYAFAVVVENAGSGNGAALQVASKVLAKL